MPRNITDNSITNIDFRLPEGVFFTDSFIGNVWRRPAIDLAGALKDSDIGKENYVYLRKVLKRHNQSRILGVLIYWLHRRLFYLEGFSRY